MKLMTLCTLILAALLPAGCTPSVRFADRPILWRDPDDGPTPLVHRHDPSVNWEGVRDAIFLPADRLFSLDYGVEAANVNALDELPDSSWWQDRRRDPAAPTARPRSLADQIASGPVGPDDEPVPPYTIVQSKIGASPGFIVEDARGQRYAFKLDPKDRVGFVTSTELVASRLAWAAGWSVPAESLIDLRRADLRVSERAYRRDTVGKKLPFTEADLSTTLRRAGTNPDGSIRALASKWIGGTILGWFHYFGRERSDVNDRYPHEDRRDLRGFGVWAAWVDDVDVFDNNTLDTYVGEPDRGHIVHYQQDVGGSFGNFAAVPIAYWMGLETAFAPAQIFGSFLTLGALPRRWDGQYVRDAHDELDGRWPEIGPFEAERFEPRKWHPILDNPAFVRQTARDRYWGAKQLVAFSEPELRAAIGAGRYRQDAANRLFDVLWTRRQKIARAYLAEVAPLDRFRLEGQQLCFDDLWIEAGLGGAAGTWYAARERSSGRLEARDRCVALPPSPGYRVVELRVRRAAERHFGPIVRVHLVDRAGVRRIVGVER